MGFVSIEPLLGDLGKFDLAGIHWVIVGGESGAGARPMKREWVLNIQRQCDEAGVPFFFKQWGGVRKSLGGRELDGQTYDEYPTPVRNRVPDADERKRLLVEFANVWPVSPSLRRRQIA
jgi:protein gp37